jgi:hypothetical protein
MDFRGYPAPDSVCLAPGKCHSGNPAEEKEAKKAHSGAPKAGPLDTFMLHSASVWVNEKTCGPCHRPWVYANTAPLCRPKRVKFRALSELGLMEFPHGSLFTANGEQQPKLHTKCYQFIKDDVHHQLKSREGNPQGGLLSQDCHTTTSAHGNGNITGTLLANV